jgi:hypothetical protein
MVSKARADKNRFLFNFMPYPICLPETKTVQAGKISGMLIFDPKSLQRQATGMWASSGSGIKWRAITLGALGSWMGSGLLCSPAAKTLIGSRQKIAAGLCGVGLIATVALPFLNGVVHHLNGASQMDFAGVHLPAVSAEWNWVACFVVKPSLKLERIRWSVWFWLLLQFRILSLKIGILRLKIGNPRLRLHQFLMYYKLVLLYLLDKSACLSVFDLLNKRSKQFANLRDGFEASHGKDVP